ncbi:hypothetical protein L596_017656 [Steinernema carpocapsae]|uniref:Saposin B-type domain-containing protein n=1 Tax=Steinernema carpocapsae TaxID=34508 RepID=A0A4U5N341_STECR|nr:hypothetical protein L596_017656 [Steinernema carpocapsae]
MLAKLTMLALVVACTVAVPIVFYEEEVKNVIPNGDDNLPGNNCHNRPPEAVRCHERHPTGVQKPTTTSTTTTAVPEVSTNNPCSGPLSPPARAQCSHLHGIGSDNVEGGIMDLWNMVKDKIKASLRQCEKDEDCAQFSLTVADNDVKIKKCIVVPFKVAKFCAVAL